MTTRAEAISRIFELDAKRTGSGELLDYFVGNSNGRGLIRIEYQGHHIASMPRGEQSETDAAFLTASADMVRIIRDLVAESEALKEAVKGYDRDMIARGLPLHMPSHNTLAASLSGAWFKEQG